MINNKIDYLEYLSKLNINQLRVEACSVVNYLDNLIEVYNDLINIVENDFIFEIQIIENFEDKNSVKDIIYKKLKQIEFFLDIEVSNLFSKKTYRCETNLADYLEMNYNDLFADIMFNYSLIFDVNEHQCPIPGTDNDDNFKVLNYSWYDALNFLSKKLLERIKIYYNELINFENVEIYDFVKRVTKEVKELVEEYGDHRIDLSRCYKDLLDNENYEILTRYNCYNQIIKTLKSNLLKNFDFTDCKNFFRNSKIVKITCDEKDIVLSTVKPNKFLILGFADYNINQIDNNIKYYKEQCIDKNCEYLFGKSDCLLVIYLS